MVKEAIYLVLKSGIIDPELGIWSHEFAAWGCLYVDSYKLCYVNNLFQFGHNARILGLIVSQYIISQYIIST